MSRPVQVGDVCKFGHEIIGENATTRKIRGKSVIRCAKCLAATARKYNSTEKGKAAHAKKDRKRRRSPGHREKRNQYVRMYRARKAEDRLDALLEAGDVAKYDDKKTAVQRILAPKPEAMPTWERMWEYMDANRTPCFERPEDFIDYDDPRYPEEATGRPMPTAFEARQMCAPCPLLELCGKFAAQNREAAGVWGGVRFIDGKRWNG